MQQFGSLVCFNTFWTAVEDDTSDCDTYTQYLDTFTVGLGKFLRIVFGKIE